MENIAKYIDHTMLSSGATNEDIIKLCKEAKEHRFYAVCVQPYMTKIAAHELQGTEIKVAAVVGFPHGATFPEIKLAEAQKCLQNGTTEIDMVINIGELRQGNHDFVFNEIKLLANSCKAKNALLKVIIETGLLSHEEKIIACELCVKAGADFVKTSTGVLKESKPATSEDVKLMYDTVKIYGLKVKASGGIKDVSTAKTLIEAGASRIGTSSGVEIVS